MNIRQCIVAMLLKALKASNLDRLGALCFIVDNLGSFDAFNWSMEGDLPISSEFIDAVEEMTRMGLVKVNGSSITLISEAPLDCGWLLGRNEGSPLSNLVALIFCKLLEAPLMQMQ